MDSKKRSVVKSITWRIVGVVILGVITYAFTRSISQTTGITVIFHGLRLILYYWHERIWERVDWGRKKHPLSHLPVREDLTPEDHLSIRSFLEERELLSKQPEYQI